jgi:hypothetical protein
MSPRYRILLISAFALFAVLIFSVAGVRIAAGLKLTPAKVRSYAESIDLAKLDAAARARAIRALADKLNALSREDRRQVRLNGVVDRWFAAMTDEEKAGFMEATLPTGYKQMITAFEEMPPERRQRAVADAVRGMREARAAMQSGQGLPPSTNAPVVSEELQKKMVTIGLKTFYSQSSAQTKAELAPLLEEMQGMMESGHLIFDRRRREQ